ncbi:MAG: bifunctional DNA-formamidopyrimidine glycosylase/DNA-(apurinic or apyrimidinic site) lyase [Anaerolineae bacterium]|nr:bifunctional DNA-formamidopyrimidine glycosylase/DNA-(apurinic or apyrimidinic site) lyase [Anaerolineae bacterium]
MGRRFVSATVLWPRTLAMPPLEEVEARLQGREVIAVGRRGKYLLMHLDDGQTLVAHLRMTGRLSIVAADSPLLEDKHTRAWFGLAGGDALVFNDSRKFGRIWLAERLEDVVGKLGPEPLAWDLTPEDSARIRRRKVAVKALLLDQTVVAGVGNIYADESLFRAGIHPLRKASTLTDAEAGRLYDALREVLNEAIQKRGTLLRDYRTPYGEDGYFQNDLRVYGKVGMPCPRCGEPIERIRVTQRSTHFCPKCQKELIED